MPPIPTDRPMSTTSHDGAITQLPTKITGYTEALQYSNTSASRMNELPTVVLEIEGFVDFSLRTYRRHR
jgi:hypothetical protein